MGKGQSYSPPTNENGGFFDHVAPVTGAPREHPTNTLLPCGSGPYRGRESFPYLAPIGLGFRVPMLVISPVQPGWTGIVGSIRSHLSVALPRDTLLARKCPI